MMPGLLTGDRLVVSKYPYGWSWVSPSFHILPPWQGRLLGQMPERGDIVIVTPPGQRRRLHQARDRPARRHDPDGRRPAGHQRQAGEVASAGRRAWSRSTSSRRADRIRSRALRLPGPAAGRQGLLPRAGRPRNAAQWRHLRHGRPRPRAERQFRPGDRSGRPRLADGRQPRPISADSRFAGPPQDGLGGPVPWENIGGRAEFITFSLDGIAVW